MAADIGTLRTRLSFEKDNNAGLEGLKRDLRGLRSEVNVFRASSSQFRTSMKGMRQESDIMTRTLATQRTRVSELGSRYRELARTKGEDNAQTRSAQSAYNNALADMKRTEAQLKRLNMLIKQQENPLYQAGTKMKALGENMQNFGRSATAFGRSYSMRVTAPIVGMGVAALKVGMDFQEGMSKVQAISGATGDELEQLTELGKKMGATTRYSATEAASGMEFLARAGWKTQDIVSGLPGVLDLAASSNMDLGRAADIASNIMSGFGIEAEKAGYVADVLAHSAANANTDVEQMGEAMKYAAPVANTLGVSIEDTAAAMMIMADSGLQGSIAGRSFASSLSRLSKPTKQMQNAMDDLNVEFFDAQGSLKPLPEMLTELEKGFKGQTKQQKAAALTTIFGTEAMKHWSILLDAGSDKLFEHSEGLSASEGAAKKMADTMTDNAKGALIEMKSALEGAGIALTENLLPAFTEIIKKVTESVRNFGELDKATQMNIIKMAALVAAVGPAAIGIGQVSIAIGGMLRVGGSLLRVIGTAQASGTLLGGFASMGVAGPVGLAIAGIAALGVGYVAYKKHAEKAKEVNLDLGISMADNARSLEDSKNAFENLTEKSKLTTKELHKLLDVHVALQNEQDPKVYEALSNEFEVLAKKSGLTKDEIIKLFEANENIIGQTPNVEKALTEKGNAFLENTKAVNEHIQALYAMSEVELELERTKNSEERVRLQKEETELLKKQNSLIEDMSKLIDYTNMGEEELKATLEEQYKVMNDSYLTGKDYQKAVDETAIIEGVIAGKIGEQVEKIQDKVDKNKEELATNQENLEKIRQTDQMLANQKLKMVGINQEGKEGIKVLDDKLAKLKQEKSELISNASETEKKTVKHREQVKELDKEINKHTEVRNKITEILSVENKSIYAKQKGTSEVEKTNSKYDSSLKKMLNIGHEQDNTNSKVKKGTTEASKLTSELGKDVKKNVDVKDNGTAKKVNDEAKKPQEKKVSLFASWANLGSAMGTLTSRIARAIPGFAEGTNFHKGGPFVAGEEGFEIGRMGNNYEMLDFGLYNRPAGYEVFTHDESKELLKKMNNPSVPKYASGVGNREINTGNNRELHLTLELNNEMDAQSVGKSVAKYVIEIDKHNSNRRGGNKY